MKKHMVLPLLVTGGGIAGFWLRLFQNRTGFDYYTGLPVAGNQWGLFLPALLAAAVSLTLLLSRALPAGTSREAESFRSAFSSHNTLPLLLLVAGVFATILSGAAETAAGMGVNVILPIGDTVFPLAAVAGSASQKLHLILGISTAACGASILSAVPACRRAGSHEVAAPSPRSVRGNLLLLPTAVLVIRLVVTYREVSILPSLMTYYVEILALSAATLAFFRLSSFAFEAGNTRRFVRYAAVAVLLCLATLADQTSICSLLLYAGCALMLLAFLLLRLENIASTHS